MRRVLIYFFPVLSVIAAAGLLVEAVQTYRFVISAVKVTGTVEEITVNRRLVNDVPTAADGYIITTNQRSIAGDQRVRFTRRSD